MMFCKTCNFIMLDTEMKYHVKSSCDLQSLGGIDQEDVETMPEFNLITKHLKENKGIYLNTLTSAETLEVLTGLKKLRIF